MAESTGHKQGYSSISAAVIVLFIVFWLASGWYRVDCALGIGEACQKIADEYATSPNTQTEQERP